ncbi:hypothetical protein IFU08_06155 [Microbacterium sp. CFBP 8790]|uniref:hypothetical protein n=1 Tax=unclassified Microbacterium TaxID=2609290 RepID=UPI00178427DA|nr:MULTISPECIES: hypothetical protein [unclassified Microbacterium]MBD8206729.1 hypothetical protein [Microbacterium sp. CFBP 8801]MBD8509148.1 hypothetical protein [Microbacterium sp. CFBP 8790]
MSVGEGDPLFFTISPFTIALNSVLALGTIVITVVSLRKRGGAKQMMTEEAAKQTISESEAPAGEQASTRQP